MEEFKTVGGRSTVSNWHRFEPRKNAAKPKVKKPRKKAKPRDNSKVNYHTGARKASLDMARKIKELTSQGLNKTEIGKILGKAPRTLRACMNNYGHLV